MMNLLPDDSRASYRLTEVSRMTGMSTNVVKKLILTGEIKAIDTGAGGPRSRYIIPKRELELFLVRSAKL